MGSGLLPPLKRTVFAGLLVVVPAVVTWWVVAALVGVLERAVWLIPGPLQPTDPVLRTVVGVAMAVAVVLAVGGLARNWLGARVVAASEAVVARLPLLSSVYGGSKQVLESILAEDSQFKSVLLVEWPRPGCWSIAFHTGDAVSVGDRRMLHVFLPCTPNPTTGYFFVVPEDEVEPTDLSIEDAFKLLVSAGLVGPKGGLRVPHRPRLGVADMGLTTTPRPWAYEEPTAK